MKRNRKIKLLFPLVFASILFLNHASGDMPSMMRIASFATSVENQDDAVKTNIYLACRKINNHIIGPKSVFSFNNTVGEGSAENGYVQGRVLYRDEVRYEPGGGLCQVSSTLFNALLMAGCTIVERHRHYQPVSYVPLGLDATIKYGKKDLRIKNPYNTPLRIEARMSDMSLQITVKSIKPLDYIYELTTEVVRQETPLDAGNYRLRNGINVFVYRLKYKGSRLIEKFLMYRDYYPAVYMK